MKSRPAVFWQLSCPKPAATSRGECAPPGAISGLWSGRHAAALRAAVERTEPGTADHHANGASGTSPGQSGETGTGDRETGEGAVILPLARQRILSTYSRLSRCSAGEWLTEKKKETWRGRAELCLEERAAPWSRTHDKRFLPSLWEYLRILPAVPRRLQKPEQQALMRSASAYYGSGRLWCWSSCSWRVGEPGNCTATTALTDWFWRFARPLPPRRKGWWRTNCLRIVAGRNRTYGRGHRCFGRSGTELRASLACLPERPIT